MPLHAVARFSKALPQGDRGGNEVQVPNPREGETEATTCTTTWMILWATTKIPPSGPFWSPEIRQIEQGYPSPSFTFEEILAPRSLLVQVWDMNRFAAYMGTW